MRRFVSHWFYDQTHAMMIVASRRIRNWPVSADYSTAPKANGPLLLVIYLKP